MYTRFTAKPHGQNRRWRTALKRLPSPPDINKPLACALAVAFLLFLAVPALASLPQGAVRLHVIANSDSPADQAAKLTVRDAVLRAMTPALTKAGGKEQARALLMENGEALQRAAEEALQRSGMAYSAHLYYGEAAFPDRLYGEKFYPAGDYEALRVVLGEGAGKNWWCVMFPPLCLIDLEGAKTPEPGEGVRFESTIVKLLEGKK